MIGKNTYFAMRKSVKGSVTAENRLGSLLNGTAAFSVDAMVRVMELATDKSVLKIEGIIDFGIHEDCVYVKLPGYPVIYSNRSQEVLKTDEWFHIGMTTDGSRVSLYLEGNYNCCVFGQAAGANCNNSIMIGDGFTGDMRYVRIFSECLDADTMKEIIHETDLSKIPLAWYDFTQNPAREQISGKLLSLKDAYIKSFTSAICLMGNSYLEVKAEDLMEVRPGYYGTQQYSVQVHFKFVTGESDTSIYYSILSDLTEYYMGGISLYLERMEDGFHLCFSHAFYGKEWNTVVSKSIIRQGKWINAAVVFNVETATMYIDGKVDCKKEGLLPACEYDTGRMFLVGAKRDDVTDSIKDYFAGYISQCDVWERALSDEEVQAYINEELDADAEELGFALDIDNDGCFNAVTYNGVALGNHAKVEEEVSDTLSGTSEVISLRQSVKEQLSETELSEIYEMCLNQWITYYEANGLDCSSEMPYRVKAWSKEETIYFVGCHNGKAYTIGTIAEKDASEVVIWWVELVLMIIGGVCAAVFGLHIKTKSNAIKQLIKMFYSNVALVNALKCMALGNITVDTFLQLFTLFYKENVLLKILKLLISGIAFWSVITICTKFASWALGYGWAAAAVQLAALVVQVGIHIASYPDRDDLDKTMCSVTLSEVKFSDLPLDGMGKRSDNIVNAGGVSAYNKGGEAVVVIESYRVIKNGKETESLSQWKRDSMDSQAVAVYTLNRARIPLEVMAAFVLTNAGNEDVTVHIWAEGTSFYGRSDEKSVLVPARQTINIKLVFQFAFYHMPSCVSEIEENISWKYRGSNSAALEEKINVKLYFILSQPCCQWLSRPIWADALKYIIPKVQGEVNMQGLYQKIAQAVNEDKQLVYTPASNYVQVSYLEKQFFLTKFLSDMFYREQSDAMECTYAVNCTDCAAIVVGLANMMGGNLRCERMGNNFLLNPIIPIGNSETGNYNTFIYHETAMHHDGTEYDKNNTVHKVYDASLKIKTPTYGYVLSVGMSFSQYTDEQVHTSLQGVQADDDSYRECLCPIVPNGVGSCDYHLENGARALPVIV
ncbi:LamG-like jellyroll fold domain-containing protein [Bacteroides acidifaciens]|uniref:LamG-like jellyroll fold domain-containing protein n=1 Tax=Bacteroides acidifaciens TaxID=85831 RepID=UPI0030156F9F